MISPQASGGAAADPASLVGLTLHDLYGRFGAPEAVYAARGEETWQDDVVLVYGAGDFYVYKDRVWQVGLKSVYGISVGDTRPVVLLALGEKAEESAGLVSMALPGGGWPLELRINLDASGRVSAMYIYRPDF